MALPYDYTKDRGLQHGANKFSTCQELLHEINGYFETCDSTIIITAYDKNGNETSRRTKPYTISGLCLYLGITRQCLHLWSDDDHPFSDLVQYAKLKITDYCETNLAQGIGTQGEIFRLKNIDSENWKEKQEINGNAGQSALLVQVMTEQSKHIEVINE